MSLSVRDIRWSQVVLAFLLGCVVTAGIFNFRRRVDVRRPDGPPYDRMLDKFSNKLNLTPDQKNKVAEIFEAKRTKLESIRSQIEPRFDELHRTTSEEIRRVLTPEQIAAFEQLEKEHADRRKRWRNRPGPTGPTR